ncbi:MAG TPA: YceI family protein [Candidatus Binataceae bacterium]|nr:YceI family protein [Candidatus Binataceae bacterium]
MRKTLCAAPTALLAAILTVAPAFAGNPQTLKGTLNLDPARTRIFFTLSGSLHTTEGTFQLKSGTISADPATGEASGEIVIDANSANTDQSLRDAKMRDSVLETQRYPEILFVPERVAGHESSDGNFTARLTGLLRLHGADHEIILEAAGRVVDDELTASTHFSVPYAAWGMTNPSILFLRVADTVEVNIVASGKVAWSAQKAPPAPSLPASSKR